MIKIIIADDHPIVRAGMKQIIAEDSDLMVADEASDGQKLLSKIKRGKFRRRHFGHFDAPYGRSWMCSNS